MSQYNSAVQNLFLASVRKKRIPVEVALNTGTSFRGKIRAFDQFSISLAFRDKVEVIYKSTILFITALAKPARRPLPPPRRPPVDPRDKGLIDPRKVVIPRSKSSPFPSRG